MILEIRPVADSLPEARASDSLLKMNPEPAVSGSSPSKVDSDNRPNKVVADSDNRPNKVVADSDNRPNKVVEDSDNSPNKVVEDSDNSPNKVVEDSDSLPSMADSDSLLTAAGSVSPPWGLMAVAPVDRVAVGQQTV